MPVRKKYAMELAREMGTQATLDVGAMWQRLLGEFLGEYDRLRRAEVGADEMERQLREFMDALSDVPVEDAARKSSSVAYNEGRDAQFKTAADATALWVVRSEVLDQATCAPCAGLDGTAVQVGTAEYAALMPPSRCLGAERCRGFYVAIPSEGASA